MKGLVIGDLSLPRESITATLVVYGGKGMGKTNLGNVLVEEWQKQGDRWCVLDPMGVWWGLRHSADGKGPGIECVILGGAHGDIPIEPTGGAIIADLVIDEQVNTIIDFSRKHNGQMWTISEKIRFVTDYTYRLFQRQGELVEGRRREPMMQILDEAARYIPQVIPSGAIDLAKCVAAWEQVCEEGRNIGLGVTFLTQRSARMNKSVSELADVMFAFRTIGPNSLSAVMDWLGEHVEKGHVRELAAQVRELEVGQALVVSPGWLKLEKIAKIRARETFDSSATPKPGQRARRVTGKAAKPDLEKYHQRMAETIEKVKADDPKTLRAQIVALQKEIREKPSVQVIAGKPTVPMGVSQWLQYGHQYGYAKFFEEKTRKEAQQIFNGANKGVKKLQDALRDIAARTEVYKSVPLFGWPVNESNEASVIKPAGNSRDISPLVTPDMSGYAKLSQAKEVLPPREISMEATTGPEQRILDAIAWANSIGIKQPNGSIIAFLAGYTNPRSTGYTNPRAALSVKGLVSYPAPGTVVLTHMGNNVANFPEAVPTEQELHARILERLTRPQSRILKILIDKRGEPILNMDLSVAAGYTNDKSTGYTNPRADLRSYGLIEYTDEGVVAAPLLFL